MSKKKTKGKKKNISKKSLEKTNTKKDKSSQNKNHKKKNLNFLLKEVVFIVAGKQSEEIVDLLSIKKYVNEFLIAKKLDITINQTRNILYKIADYSLVSSIRKRDKKKGWYTYFWKIEALRALEFLKSYKIKRLEQVNNQLKSREQNRFYICERCKIELKEENALYHDFTCQECGSVFQLKNNSKLIRELKKKKKKIFRDLEIINEEIKKEENRIGKQREKEFKKKALKRKRKRRKTMKRKAKERAKKKTDKKSLKSKKKSKKTTKKKPVKKKTKSKKKSKKSKSKSKKSSTKKKK